MSHAAKQVGSSGVCWLQGVTHWSQARQAVFTAQAARGLWQLWIEHCWQLFAIPLDELDEATDEVPKPDELDELDPPLHIWRHPRAAPPEMGHGRFEMHCARQSSCAFTWLHVIPYCMQTSVPHEAACMHAASHVGSGPPLLDELDTLTVVVAPLELEETADPPVPELETAVMPVAVVVVAVPVPAAPLPPVPVVSMLLPQPANHATAPITANHPEAKANARILRSPSRARSGRSSSLPSRFVPTQAFSVRKGYARALR